MASRSNTSKKVSRRGILPVLGSAFLLPFVGLGRTPSNEITDSDQEEYKTLLKPDGTIVKVRASSLKQARIVRKNMSNSSFLKWLGKKL